MQHSQSGSLGSANAFLQALGTMLTAPVLSPLTDERDSALLHVAKSQLQDCIQLGDLASRGSMRTWKKVAEATVVQQPSPVRTEGQVGGVYSRGNYLLLVL